MSALQKSKKRKRVKNEKRILNSQALVLLSFFIFNSLVGCNDDGNGGLYESAQRFWEKKMYGMAAQNYEQFCFGDPEHPKAAQSLYKAAFIYAYYLGEFPRAIELFLRLIMLYPASPYRLTAHQDLAEIYTTHLKRYPQAISQYEKTLEIQGQGHEDLSETHYKIGRCYFLMGDWERAQETFERMLRGFPEGTYADSAAYQIGYIHYVEGRFEDAERAFRLFLEQYPKSDWAFDGMLHLAKSKEKQHQTDASRELYKKLQERFPGRMRDSGEKQVGR